MCLVLYKVCVLCVSVFTNPLVTYTKKAHLNKDLRGTNPHFRRFLIKFGHKITKS